MKNLRTALLAATCVWAATVASAADAWPVKPIKLVVMYGAGGANDIIARTVGAKLSEALGQPVLVENRPGAAGMIASRYVASSPPDGYTLLSGGAPLVINPTLFAKPGVDALRDFTPVTKMVELPLIVAARPDLPYQNLKEFIAAAKLRPDEFTVAVAASAYMLVNARIGQMTGIKVRRIDYKAVPDMNNDLTAGRVDLMIDAVGPALPQIKAGRLKALAVLGAQRHPALPDVPTAEEAGLKGLVEVPFVGILAPAGLPREVQEKLSGALLRILKDEDFRTRMETVGFTIAPGTPEQFSQRMRDDIERYQVLGKQAGIVKE